MDLRPLEKSPWDGSTLEVITPQKNVGSDDTDNPFNTDVMVPDDFFNPDNPIPEMNSEEDQNEIQNKNQNEDQNKIDYNKQTQEDAETIDNSEEGKQ